MTPTPTDNTTEAHMESKPEPEEHFAIIAGAIVGLSILGASVILYFAKSCAV